MTFSSLTLTSHVTTIATVISFQQREAKKKFSNVSHLNVYSLPTSKAFPTRHKFLYDCRSFFLFRQASTSVSDLGEPFLSR